MGISMMDTDKKAQIKAHSQAIAALLYQKTNPNLARIEKVVRGHVLEPASPEIEEFYFNRKSHNK